MSEGAGLGPLAAIAEGRGEAIVVVGADLRVCRWSEAAVRLLGWTEGEVVGRPVRPLVRPDLDEDSWAAACARLTEVAASVDVVPFRRKDGGEGLAELAMTALHDAEGRPAGLVLLLSDVTARVEAEQSLTDAQGLLETSMRASKTTSFEWDAAAGTLRYDPRFHRWPEVPEVLHGSLDSMLPKLASPEGETLTRDIMQGLTEGTATFSFEHRRPSLDGAGPWVRVAGQVLERGEGGEPRRICGTVTDITEAKELQARASSAERTASLATLAAGMSHEINNPLAVLIANVYVVSEALVRAPDDARAAWARAGGEGLDALVEGLRDARTAANRIRDIVASLRAFAGRAFPSRVRCDIDAALAVAYEVARNAIPERAHVRTALPELPEVAIDEASLVHVFAGLLTNAGQAGGPSGCKVEVTGARAGEGSVVVVVSDSGRGMSRETLARVFDPFFTTRPLGLGRGLGLCACLGIVRSAGGDLEIKSTEGVGTEVRVRLPVVRAAAAVGSPG